MNNIFVLQTVFFFVVRVTFYPIVNIYHLNIYCRYNSGVNFCKKIFCGNFFCGTLIFFQIAEENTKIRSRKNLVPHGSPPKKLFKQKQAQGWPNVIHHILAKKIAPSHLTPLPPHSSLPKINIYWLVKKEITVLGVYGKGMLIQIISLCLAFYSLFFWLMLPHERPFIGGNTVSPLVNNTVL